MRPLSVQVFAKEEEDEEDEYKEDNCVLRLPDGTIHTLADVESPSHARLPLPTITEQVRREEPLHCQTDREQGAGGEPTTERGSELRLSAKKKNRKRTESETEGSLEGSKSGLGLKSPIKDCKMPRNQSAPHFVLANRNMSTVFTPIARYGEYNYVTVKSNEGMKR